jgi:hypothetical protein
MHMCLKITEILGNGRPLRMHICEDVNVVNVYS